ncbi:MAG: hypothetical protein M0C28_44525 [Candidatus Moduliflexus flocculans]|nr:hypothetical protein [Candidatus Moduliflexus flocculans]
MEDDKSIRILGVGIEPSEGIRKGIIVDLGAASQAIARSVKKAERTSGLEITSALVSLAGAHVSSVNSRGVVGSYWTISSSRMTLTAPWKQARGGCHPLQPRDHPRHPARLLRGRAGRHPQADWDARLPPGSGSAHHHGGRSNGGQPAPVRGRGRR